MEWTLELQLYKIAEDQAGYFSLSQARELGLRRSQIYRGVRRGKLERAEWGVYRFVQFPATRYEPIHIAVLSAGSNAIVGFETALYVYELSDIIPDEIDLILPATSSRRRPGIRVHTTKIETTDVTQYEGLPITTVARSIADATFSNIDEEQVKLAVAQSLKRGMTTKQKLLKQAGRRPARVLKLISSVIDEINQ